MQHENASLQKQKNEKQITVSIEVILTQGIRIKCAVAPDLIQTVYY